MGTQQACHVALLLAKPRARVVAHCRSVPLGLVSGAGRVQLLLLYSIMSEYLGLQGVLVARNVLESAKLWVDQKGPLLCTTKVQTFLLCNKWHP